MKSGRLEPWQARAIIQAAEEAIAGKLDDQFPLFVWQTGSGTQSNMNVNEVLSTARSSCSAAAGHQPPVARTTTSTWAKACNDTFPTAMHIATLTEIDERLLPRVTALHARSPTSPPWMDVVKIGRTHLEDAVPLSVGRNGQAGPRSLTRARRTSPLPQRLAGVGRRWHRGGHGSQRSARVQSRGGRHARRTHRQALRHRAEQVRRAGVAGPDGAATPGCAAWRSR